MKKVLSVLLVFIMMLGLAACGNTTLVSESSAQQSDQASSEYSKQVSDIPSKESTTESTESSLPGESSSILEESEPADIEQKTLFSATIFYVDMGSSYDREQAAECVYFDGTANGLFEAMQSRRFIPATATLGSFEITDNKGTLDIIYAEGENGFWTDDEPGYRRVYALYNSFIATFGLDDLTFMVNSVPFSNGSTKEFFSNNQSAILLRYSLDDDFGSRYISFDGTAEGMINSMAKNGFIPGGTVLNSFRQYDKAIFIDLSSEFVSAFSDAAYGEKVMRNVVDALGLWFDASAVAVTVDGNRIKTPECDYSLPLTVESYQ